MFLVYVCSGVTCDKIQLSQQIYETSALVVGVRSSLSGRHKDTLLSTVTYPQTAERTERRLSAADVNPIVV